MIDRQTFAAILDQYEKHGWKLRRVLLSSELRDIDPDTAALCSEADLQDAEIEAAWFSRSSRPGITAWELRHLSTTPFAVLETIRDGTPADEVEEILGRTEAKLQEAVSRRRSN
jgi:hypothetical protein